MAPPADRGDLRDAVVRFATLISPALAGYLLAPVVAGRGQPILDEDAVASDRLFKKFTLSQQRRWARCLAESGIGVVFMKGFANAHTLYGDPAVRAQGDLDILVHGADLSRTVAFLSSHGFRFRAGPVAPWGLISDASFMPMVSPDGACAIDIHIQPDCYPVHRSLTAECVFAEAQEVQADDFLFLSPCREHALLLCATNAAKDKFFLSSVPKVIDGIVMLRAHAPAIDWDRIAGLARDGAYTRPLMTFLALLRALGMPMASVPPALWRAPRGLRGAVFRGVVDDYRALFPQDVPLTVYLAREWLIGAEPRVALHNLLVRARGLLRPSDGIPRDGPVEEGDVLILDRPEADGRALDPDLPRALRSNAR